MEILTSLVSGNEIGPFRAIEESTLAHLTPKDIRSDVFAWYTLMGSAGTAIGTITCGWLVQALLSGGWSDVRAYRAVFGIYAVLGLVKLGLSVMLSENCEPEPPKQEYQEVVEMDDADAHSLLSDSEEEEADPSSRNDPIRKETQPDRMSQKPQQETPSKKSTFSAFSAISRESRSTLIKLCLLFAVDSGASGLVPPTWITYFFTRKFNLPEGQLGTLFFVTSIVAAVGTLAASSIARRIGLIKTMVLTHLPSAVFLALIPLPPQAWLAMTFLILRHSMSSMDQAPRQAFLSSAVLPNERTAVMGIVNVVKTLSQSVGPVGTGALAGVGKFWIAFLIAGAMKAAYDLSLLKMFLGFRGREDEEVGKRGRRQESGQP